ncbi:MAG: superinfection immunity protein [Pseudomonadales bacterium]|nr:superinfection immunity protein [Pseudomonadales bacterium]
MNEGAIVFILAFAGFFYFVPTFIALKRNHTNVAAIAALNILLGWTLLGWIGSLIWSLTAQNRES